MKFSKEHSGEKTTTVIIPNDETAITTASLSVSEKLGIIPEEKSGATLRICFTDLNGKQVNFEGTQVFIETISVRLNT